MGHYGHLEHFVLGSRTKITENTYYSLEIQAMLSITRESVARVPMPIPIRDVTTCKWHSTMQGPVDPPTLPDKGIEH